MPTLPQSIHDQMQKLRKAAVPAVKLLKARPALLVLAILAWGIQFVSEYDNALAFITVLIKVVLSAAFFGVVAEILTVKDSRITWKLISTSIRRLTVGTVVITMVYTLPVILIAPFINIALGSRLEGASWALTILISPTVVPSIAAIWSLAYLRSSLVQAIYDGLHLMRGRWAMGLVLGLIYQTLAAGGLDLRMRLLQSSLGFVGPLVAGLIMLAWVVAEALFRVTLLYFLVDDVPKPVPKKP